MSSAKFAKPLWHLVDAKNQVVGRLATQIVGVLRGKHKPNFSPNYDCGDYVVVSLIRIRISYKYTHISILH
jgi:large subunit ribosomal protein L13